LERDLIVDFFFKYYFLGCNLVRFHTMLLFWNW